MYQYKIIRNITGTLEKCGRYYTRTFGIFRGSSIVFLVLLYLPLFLSFVAMPSLCCFFRVTTKNSAEQYNIVLSLYYCPILERTVFAVGAMVADAVSKGADKQNVIKFNKRSYRSWSQACEAYWAVSRSAKVNSVWNQVFVAAEDIEDDEKPFQLKCKAYRRNRQLNNPSKWKKEHNYKVIAPKGVRSGSVAALLGAHFGILSRFNETDFYVLTLENLRVGYICCMRQQLMQGDQQRRRRLLWPEVRRR